MGMKPDRLLAPLVLLLVCLVPLVAAADQFQDNYERCTAFGGGSPTQQIRACTWLLESGRLTAGLSGRKANERYALVHSRRAAGYFRLAEGDIVRGNLDRARPDLERAIADYSTVIARYPVPTGVLSTASMLRSRGRMHVFAGDFNRAIADFSEGIRRQDRKDPRAYELYVARARAYRKKGDFPAAISDLQTAHVLEPAYAGNVVELAWTHYLAGDPRQAVQEAERALTMDAMNERASETIGHALVALGDKQQAVLQFQRAMLLGGSSRIWLYQDALAKHGYKVEKTKTYDLATYQALTACVQAGCRLIE